MRYFDKEKMHGLPAEQLDAVMEEAIRLASMHPTTQVDQGEAYGWRTEVRPVHFFKNDK